MLIVLDTVVVAAVAFGLAPTFLLIAELTASLRQRSGASRTSEYRPSTVIVMPAHDEAVIIQSTIAALKPELVDGVRLLVVADNCTDETARLAAEAGADVVERHDPVRRGKPFALDHAIRHLSSAPPDVVIILDADCSIAPGGIALLAEEAMASNRPVQAKYILEPHPEGGIGQRVSAFAFLVKNHCRLLGLQSLAGGCHLVGSGMAFPWAAIRGLSFASATLAEDIKLGIDLLRAGKPAKYCPRVLVTSEFPRTAEAHLRQRKRWEHGLLDILGGEAPSLLGTALATRDWCQLCFALDLMVPPLTLLLGLLGSATLLAAVLASMGATAIPLLMLLTTGSALGIALLLAWHRYGQDVLPAAGLAAVPRYAVSKVGLYTGFIRKRQTEWVRTDRS